MSTSYQDIDSRLRTIESQVSFILNCFTVKKTVPNLMSPTGGAIVREATMLEMWRELQTLGGNAVIERVDGGIAATVPPETPAEES